MNVTLFSAISPSPQFLMIEAAKELVNSVIAAVKRFFAAMIERPTVREMIQLLQSEKPDIIQLHNVRKGLSEKTNQQYEAIMRSTINEAPAARLAQARQFFEGLIT